MDESNELDEATYISEKAQMRIAIVEELRRKLKCLECDQLREPPFYQCPRSHLVCKPCHGNEAECSECESTDLCGRAFILEKLHPYLFVPCEYKGCDFVGAVTEHDEHKNNCEFCEVPCLSYGCTAHFVPNKVFEHFEVTHPEELLLNDDESKRVMVQYTEDNERVCMNVIKHEGEILLLGIFIGNDTDYLEYIATNFECKFRTETMKKFHFIFPSKDDEPGKKVTYDFYKSTFEEKDEGLEPMHIMDYKFPCKDFFPHELQLNFKEELHFEVIKKSPQESSSESVV